MADVILNSTVFVEKLAGPGTVYRFAEFARVTTPLGAMVEPFIIGDKVPTSADIQNYDATDEMCRIDDIQFVDLDKIPTMLGDGEGPAYHGGTQLPRTGR